MASVNPKLHRPHRRKILKQFPAASSSQSMSASHDNDLQDAPVSVASALRSMTGPAHVTATTNGPSPDADSFAEVTGPEQAYVDRTQVLSDVRFDETSVTGYSLEHDAHAHSFSLLDAHVLSTHGAFTLSEPAEQQELIRHFMESCWPWTPIVDEAWLGDTDGRPSHPLLLQAVLMAGSRVAAEESTVVSQSLFYKAKALFFHWNEPRPLMSVLAAIILQWWSPAGPEQLSRSNSGFWLHIAVGLAYQLGLHKEAAPGLASSLRRRIWWSLVCRDILISVGVGRPRIINLEDSDVLPPTVADFPKPDRQAQLFVAYTQACQILGNLVQDRRRGLLSSTNKKLFEVQLYHWIRELGSDLRLFSSTKPAKLSVYEVGARQLHVLYFVIVIILESFETCNKPSTASIIAASFIAGIYAEFAEHDHVQRLGPIFAFHALTAALSLLKACRCSALAAIALEDFDNIYQTLLRLAKKWGSAHGLLKPLLATRRSTETEITSDSPIAPLSLAMMPLFREFGPSKLCRVWNLCCTSATDDTCAAVLRANEHGVGERTTAADTTSDDVAEDMSSLVSELPDAEWNDLMNDPVDGGEGHNAQDPWPQGIDHFWNELMESWTAYGGFV